MTNWRPLVCVGFLLAATSAFPQSGSPAEGSTIDASPARTPTPTETPNVFSPQTLADLKRIRQAALVSEYALSAGGASFEQHRAALERFGTGGEGR